MYYVISLDELYLLSTNNNNIFLNPFNIYIMSQKKIILFTFVDRQTNIQTPTTLFVDTYNDFADWLYEHPDAVIGNLMTVHEAPISQTRLDEVEVESQMPEFERFSRSMSRNAEVSLPE